MPDDDQVLHPPMAPSPLWWVAVAALVALAVLLLAWVAVTLRRRHGEPAGLTVEDRRAETLAAIDDVAAAHRRGNLPTSTACQRLGRLVRRFVGECSGRDVEVLTADELRAAAILDHRLDPAAQFATAVRAGSFARDATVDVEELVRGAREVVAQWN